MKKVQATSHDAIYYGEVPWSDVWIRFTAKPGRTIKRYGPTFIGKRSLLQDIEITRELMAKYTVHDWQPELNEQMHALEQVEQHGVFIGRGCGVDIPNIYINKDYITKKDVDHAIDVFMRSLGYSGAVVKWSKAPKFVIHPA